MHKLALGKGEQRLAGKASCRTLSSLALTLLAFGLVSRANPRVLLDIVEP